MAYLHLAPNLDLERAPARAVLPIRVVLADDHLAARRSLRRLLDAEEDVHVMAEAGDLTALVERVSRHRPHVLLLDLQMPSGSTLEAIRRLRTRRPATEIIFLTMQNSAALAQQAIAAGAVGFVLKDYADDELLEAVCSAARGEEYISPRVATGVDALRGRLVGR